MADTITISLDEYQRLRGAAEALEDLAAYDAAKRRLAAGEDELVPETVVNRLLADEKPLRVWREQRGLSQMALAAASGVNRVQIADIEAGRASGSIETLKRLACALSLPVDDLI